MEILLGYWNYQIRTQNLMTWTLALNLLCIHHSEMKIIKMHILSFVTYCIEEGSPEFQVTQEILMCGMWACGVFLTHFTA